MSTIRSSTRRARPTSRSTTASRTSASRISSSSSGPGNDVFSVKSTHDGTTSVFGNGGIDTINVGAKKAPSGSNQEDLGVLNNVGGTLTVNGGAGDDVLNVYDDGDTHPAELAGQYLSVGHLAATTVSGSGRPAPASSTRTSARSTCASA